MSLKGKIVVITGGSKGIGRETAAECCRRGASLFISARSQTAIDQTVSELRSKGGRIAGLAADVSKPQDTQRLFEAALKEYGAIDVWINNAGLSHPYYPLDEIPEQKIRQVLDTNIAGIIWAARIVLPYLRQHGGVVINVNGMGSDLRAAPYSAVYAASKAAVNSLTKSLARENKAYPVSVVSFMPGIVSTDLVNNVEYAPQLSGDKEVFRYVTKAFGNPIQTVAAAFADTAGLKPGVKNGQEISLLKGCRLLKGILLMSWYGMSGKLKRA